MTYTLGPAPWPAPTPPEAPRPRRRAGGDCIDDVGVRPRRRNRPRSWFFTGKAPSTLGSFKWGHVRQLNRVGRELLARAWQAGAEPGDGPLTIDLDSTICDTSRLTRFFQADGRWWVEGHQLVAQLGGSTLGGAQCPLLILTFVVFGASVHVLLAVSEHGVDDAGQLVRCRRDGLGRSQVGFLSAQEGAQGAVGAVQRVGRQTQMPPRPGWRWAWSLS